MNKDNYVSTCTVFTMEGKTSPNLFDFMSPDLTLDLNSQSGFKEVGVVNLWENAMVDDCEKNITDLNQLCKTLLSLLQESIEGCWDPKDKHLVYISGGCDSRIICYTLKKLEQIHGKDWLGEVKFITRKEDVNSINSIDSTTIVRTLMKKLEWDLLETTRLDFSPELVPNAFLAFDIKYYSPLTTDYKELKNWVVVSGNWGGEQTHYPVYKGFTNDRYKDLTKWMMTARYNSVLFAFKDFLQPYLYKPYIHTVFKIHPSLFVGKKLGDGDRWEDRIRHGMLTMLGDSFSRYYGHDYSTCRKDGIEYVKLAQKLWDKSKFKKDFSKQLGEKKNIKLQDVWEWGTNDLNAKLFGLAMTYDHKFK